jgi:steroid 5-alpha reductase family enzyme
MIGTILLLLVTVVLVPVLSFFYGEPLSATQELIMHDMLYIVGGVIAYCFVVGELSGNTSQTDKLWSIVPIGYVWYMTWMDGMPDKMILMSVLVTLWGARLTYNFGRRGGYSWKFWDGEEDYRWEVLRQKPVLNNRVVWGIFNLVFISGYQHVLIFLFTVPILAVAGTQAAHDITIADWIIALAMLVTVVLEYIADQQQYDFQTEKYRRINAGEDLGEYSHGFVRTGLWGLMRHPNYAMEQLVWILFYLFSISATGEWLHWSITGVLLLLILFKTSSDFSETISAEKYPEYKNYQRNVPRFIPWTKFKASA